MFFQGTAEQRLHRRLSTQTSAHSFDLALEYHWSQSIGTIEKTLEQGLHGCENILSQFLSILLPVAIELVIVCVVLAHFGQPTYLTIFGISAISYGVIYWIGARLSGKTARAVSVARIETGAFLNDGFSCIEILKSFRAIRWFLFLYGKHLCNVESLSRHFYGRRRWTGQLAGLVFGGSALAALLFTVKGIEAGRMTVGDLVLIQAYLFRLTQPLEQLGYAVRELSQGMANLDRLLTLLRERPESDDARSHTPQPHGKITFNNVSFTHARASCPTLEELNFTIEPGTIVAIVGRNGAGKSTLGRLLLRSYEPDSGGSIELDGVSLKDISRDDLSDIIVTVPQETILLHTTLRDNITLGADVSELQMARVLRLAQLENIVADLPDGLDTIVGQRGMRLSGGQRQRVAIARALLRDATVILCDEATASLDQNTEQELIPVLMRLAERRTTVIVTHQPNIAALADSVLFLDRGRIVNQGPHAYLMENDPAYAQLWAQRESAAVAVALPA
jgi:ATP-binding cassette subfamily B protein